MKLLIWYISVFGLFVGVAADSYSAAAAPSVLAPCIISYSESSLGSTGSKVVLYNSDGTFLELSSTYTSMLGTGSSSPNSGSYTYSLDPNNPSHATISYSGGSISNDNLYFSSSTSGSQSPSNVTAGSITGFTIYPKQTDQGIVAFSTRCELNANGSVTVGFVVAPGGPRWVLIRAVTSSLANYGVVSSLSYPTFNLYNAMGQVLGTSSVWSADPNLVAGYDAVFAMVGEFPLTSGSHEGVMLTPLKPGAYTAIFKGTGSGQILCEAYLLPY